MTEELYIDGQAVDLKPGAATTLNYKSNLLGDLSKITSSNSQTIQCPKTTRNRRIFDNPGAPAYVSGRRYKRYSARLERNGVEVVRVGYAVLLSASEHYEIGLYWGVMSRFQEWVDKAAKLNELAGSEALTWDKSITPTALSTLKSRGYGYAQYDCGVSNTDLTNIHPSATAWWILNKIATQAGFTFEMPERYETALRATAVPCLSRNASKESNEAEALKGIAAYGYYNGYFAINRSGVIQNPRGITLGSGNVIWLLKTDKLHGNLYLSMLGTNGASTFTIRQAKSTGSNSMKLWVKFYKWGSTGSVAEQVNQQIGQSISKTTSGNVDTFTFEKITACFDISGWDAIVIRQEPMVSSTGVTNIPYCEIYVWSDWEDMVYPSAFRIASNLPDITQIDFIKAICAMLGIFVVTDPTDADKLKFVSFDSLQTNKARAADWSDKLVRSNEDEPKTTQFKINDYCRNNYFRYKEDDTVATHADGNLKIDSELLEKEKIVITLPFAPSDGSSIPHYKPSGDGTGVDTIQVKERIMRLVNDGAGRASLTFDGMSFEALLASYYKSLSRLLDRAIATTEAIRLDEYDLKSLDYSVPFYLGQYGKYYGIVSIQSTADKACEVKAIQLPETVEDEPIDPSLITNLIAVREEPMVAKLTALYPLASDVTVDYDYYGYAMGGEPSPGSIVFPRGSTEITLLLKTRDYLRTELRSLSPASDDMYNYIIAEQTPEQV
ncbi:hypothetical protein [Alistipes sp.]|uniref:hypothetical protein n=1 Tax=Alistipes sp. TaxID=1872444 RepID=UPI003AEF9460